MKLSVFSCIAVLFLLIYPQYGIAQDDIYTRRVERHMRFWQNLTPKYTKFQFAGSMGMMSLGTGWNYGNNHWETDVLLGIIPRNSDRRAIPTFTLKQNYIPWQVKLAGKVIFEPLSCGVYLNTLLSRDFWVSNPNKYPKGYYFFSTKIRSHIFWGERITFNLDPAKWPGKSITLFY